MHVAVLQSAYIPWRGYFDIIASVDLFIIYDDVQYSKGSWRNRNKVKTVTGPKWVTIPVHVEFGQPISDVKIDYGAKDWIEQHRGLFRQSLRDAPYFETAIEPWEACVASRPASLSDLNISLLRSYCSRLGIDTTFADSRDHALEGSSTDRLLMLLQSVGATSYLSGPAAQAYLDVGAFQRAGIDLFYKSYDYEPYPQIGSGFQPDTTIIDLIANVGPRAGETIRSRTADRRVT